MGGADQKMLKLVILNDLLAYFVIPSEELLYRVREFSPHSIIWSSFCFLMSCMLCHLHCKWGHSPLRTYSMKHIRLVQLSYKCTVGLYNCITANFFFSPVFILHNFACCLKKKPTHDCFDRKGWPIPTSALSVHNLPTLGSVQANTVCTQCTMINPQIVYWGRNHSAKKENPSFLSTTCTLLLPSFSFNLKVLSAWKYGHGFFWENLVYTCCNYT